MWRHDAVAESEKWGRWLATNWLDDVGPIQQNQHHHHHQRMSPPCQTALKSNWMSRQDKIIPTNHWTIFSRKDAFISVWSHSLWCPFCWQQTFSVRSFSGFISKFLPPQKNYSILIYSRSLICVDLLLSEGRHVPVTSQSVLIFILQAL